MRRVRKCQEKKTNKNWSRILTNRIQTKTKISKFFFIKQNFKVDTGTAKITIILKKETNLQTAAYLPICKDLVRHRFKF